MKVYKKYKNKYDRRSEVISEIIDLLELKLLVYLNRYYRKTVIASFDYNNSEKTFRRRKNVMLSNLFHNLARIFEMSSDRCDNLFVRYMSRCDAYINDYIE